MMEVSTMDMKKNRSFTFDHYLYHRNGRMRINYESSIRSAQISSVGRQLDSGAII